jgi:hypothetical protein
MKNKNAEEAGRILEELDYILQSDSVNITEEKVGIAQTKALLAVAEELNQLNAFLERHSLGKMLNVRV